MPTVRFNGYNLTKKFYLLDDLSRPLPEFRHVSSEIAGEDGLEFDSQTIGMRTCSFSLAADAATQVEMQRLWRELADALLVRKPVKLTFSDEKDSHGTQLVRYAVPAGIPDLTEWIKAGKMTLTFEQDDPYLYGRERAVVLKKNTTKKVQVGGNAPAHPVFTADVNGSASSVALSLLTSAGAVKRVVSVAFSAGTARKVVLDELNLSATVTPSTGSTGITTGSRFFTIDSTCYLKANAAGTLSWQERWI